MSAAFPKILVATEFPPNASGGGPAVVRQMLKGWPSDKLCWWSCLSDSTANFGREVGTHRIAQIPSRLYPHEKFTHLKGWLLETLWTGWAARQLRGAIRDLRPDVIWAIPHQWAISPLAAALPNSGVGFHVTVQDFPDSQSYIARLGAGRSARFAAEARLLYQAATTRDATSHPMIAELARTTARPAAQMLHAGLEESDFGALAEMSSSGESTIRIAYAGTIVVEDVFVIFVEALRELRRTGNRRLELQLFSAHRYRERPWFEPDWMTENGNLPEEELGARLRDCTWAFAPMALTDEDPRYNRFSFPTKFITYLAAGLPIITLGHSQSSLVQMARRYHVGPCLDETSLSGLFSELDDIFQVVEPRRLFRDEIVRCAREEFNATRMRRTLYEAFQQCAGRS